MDLAAYIKMKEENLDRVLEQNNIRIPRLRGVRVMVEEERLTKADYQEAYKAMREWEISRRNLAMKAALYFHCKWRMKRYGLRKAVKNRWKAIVKNFNTFNHFVGQPDVLCIHARIGGMNWLDFGGERIAEQPWFICKVDDYFDNTYCDIYVRVKNEYI